MDRTTYQVVLETQDDTSAVVSLADLKKHVAIDSTESYYDDMLQSMEQAAVAFIESKSRLVLRNSSYEIFCNQFPGGADPLYIPLWPVRSVTDIVYTDQSGSVVVITNAQKILSTPPAAMYPAVDTEWPMAQEGNRQSVTFSATVGYQNNAAVPAMVKHAIKMLVAHWFRNRETVLVGSISKELEKAVDALMVQFRSNYWRSFGVYQ